MCSLPDPACVSSSVFQITDPITDQANPISHCKRVVAVGSVLTDRLAAALLLLLVLLSDLDDGAATREPGRGALTGVEGLARHNTVDF